MSDLAGLVFEIIKDRLPFSVTRQAFAESINHYELHPVIVGGKTVGAIMRKGSELHAAVLPTARKRWMTKTVLRFIAETVAEHGKAITKVMPDHEAGHAFALRLGFKPMGMEHGLVLYELRAEQ